MRSMTHTSLRALAVTLAVVGLGTVAAHGLDGNLWDTKNDMTAMRFEVLNEFHGEAILDKDTQLVWERSPGSSGALWMNAQAACAMKSIGGTQGWRLPSFYELMSLVDPSVQGDPARPTLTSGHPFMGVEATSYWSSTTPSSDPSRAYAVDFLVGNLTVLGKHAIRGYWCVRGIPSQGDGDHGAPHLQMVRLGSESGSAAAWPSRPWAI